MEVTLAHNHLTILNLLAHYAELLDARDYQAVGALFRHGRITGAGSEKETVGPEAVAELFASFGAGQGSGGPVHQMTTNVHIDFADDGLRARSRAYFLVVGWEVAPVVRFFGRYEDEFAVIDGERCFTRRHMIPEFPASWPPGLSPPRHGTEDCDRPAHWWWSSGSPR